MEQLRDIIKQLCQFENCNKIIINVKDINGEVKINSASWPDEGKVEHITIE